MKGDLTLKILEGLERTARAMEELLVIFTSPYGSSMGQIERRLETFRNQRELSQSHDLARSRHSFYDLLHRLKKDGLIEEVSKKDQKALRITGIGKLALTQLKTRRAERLPETHYPKEKEVSLKVVIFDIPERERRKRRWINAVLKNLGFVRLQKSVWGGKTRIPETFLKDLSRLQLIPHIEIFVISKTGSLKQMPL